MNQGANNTNSMQTMSPPGLKHGNNPPDSARLFDHQQNFVGSPD
jgi:hypothetical protein